MKKMFFLRPFVHSLASPGRWAQRTGHSDEIPGTRLASLPALRPHVDHPG